jgi:hypothetical protein
VKITRGPDSVDFVLINLHEVAERERRVRFILVQGGGEGEATARHGRVSRFTLTAVVPVPTMSATMIRAPLR